jgi:hypothetical protein
MTLIIFDFIYLQRNKINEKLIKKFQPYFKNIGIIEGIEKALILDIPSHEYQNIKNISPNQRKELISNLDFDNNKFVPLIIFENKKQIHLFHSSPFLVKNIKDILSLLYENFPHDFKIKLSLKLKENFVNEYLPLLNYFSFPKFDNLNSTIILYKINDLKESKLKDNISLLIHVLYSLEGKGKDCKVYIKLTNNSISKLKLLQKMIFHSDKKFKGLEVSDKFNISKIELEKVFPKLTLDISENFNKIGNDYMVDVVYSKYTFHTHPTKTYQKFNVKYAWPSYQDLESFLVLFQMEFTIFHIVATQEGIYTIQINPKFIPYIQSLSEDQIKELTKKNYSVPYPEIGKDIQKNKVSTPQEYISIINKKKLKKDLPPALIINFIEWDKVDKNLIFEVDYYSSDNVCEISDLQID